jgi:glycerol-3-phosphate acyltransferase PlsY
VDTVTRLAVPLLLAYLLGAFPTGYLVVRAFTGQDVRRLGSGRTGGTNVLRSAGLVPAIVTVAGDLLKGLLAVVLAHALAPTPLAVAAASVAAILGHNYSVFLSFDGGAGTMTSIGVALFMSPVVGAAVIVLGLAILILRRYASLASITVAVAMPALFGAGSLWFGLPPLYCIGTAAITLVVIYELRPNICRLLKGTERRIALHLTHTSPAADRSA